MQDGVRVGVEIGGDIQKIQTLISKINKSWVCSIQQDGDYG